jgi:hypothetical protein
MGLIRGWRGGGNFCRVLARSRLATSEQPGIQRKTNQVFRSASGYLTSNCMSTGYRFKPDALNLPFAL